jgi:hypothetical protein
MRTWRMIEGLVMRYRRNPAVTTTEFENEFFLVEPDEDEVYYLDALSGGVWRLLERPQTLEDLVEVYEAAFPETPGEQIGRDLRAMLADMLEHKVIVADA